MNRFSRVASCIGLAVISALSLSWIDTGHMVIAAIARRELKPDVLKEVDRLSAIGGTRRTSDFITGSCWADDIRSERRETGPWHYMDLHFRTDGKRTDNKPDAENAAWAIEKFSAVLADRTKPDAERADALRFIVHFVGDIHQPLHGTARDSDEHPKGDRGGNDFAIEAPASMKDSSRPPRNLHSLWDLGAGLFSGEQRPLAADSVRHIEVEAVALTAALPRSSFRRIGEANPEKWARESFEAAKAHTYRTTEGAAPTEEYMRDARTTAAQRAVLAGYRLADLLNRVLG